MCVCVSFIDGAGSGCVRRSLSVPVAGAAVFGLLLLRMEPLCLLVFCRVVVVVNLDTNGRSSVAAV